MVLCTCCDCIFTTFIYSRAERKYTADGGPNLCKSRKEYDLSFASPSPPSASFLRTADFTLRVEDLFFQWESADETLSNFAAPAFCITSGHICPNYSNTWMALGSQCGSEFVILTPPPLDNIIEWESRTSCFSVTRVIRYTGSFVQETGNSPACFKTPSLQHF